MLESFCRYLEPTRFDDVLHVHARCVDLRGARFRFEYLIVQDGGIVVADGWTQHACVDAQTLRPTRVPGWLADAIRSVESSSPASSSTRSSSASTS